MGDFPGHPFRGNQHTEDGEGGGADALGSARKEFLSARKAGGGDFGKGSGTSVSKGDYKAGQTRPAGTGPVKSGETVEGVELKTVPNGGATDVKTKINGAAFDLSGMWMSEPHITTQIGFTRGEGGIERATAVLDRFVEHARAAGKSSIVLASGNPQSRSRGFDSEDSKFVDAVSKSRGGIRIEGDKQGTWFAKIRVSQYKRR